MITGHVNDAPEPVVSIEVIGPSPFKVPEILKM
jgi:hypothetical protein